MPPLEFFLTTRHERVASYDSRLLSSHLNAWYSPAPITTAKRERKRATLLSFSKTIYGVLRGNADRSPRPLPRFLKRVSLTTISKILSSSCLKFCSTISALTVLCKHEVIVEEGKEKFWYLIQSNRERYVNDLIFFASNAYNN